MHCARRAASSSSSNATSFVRAAFTVSRRQRSVLLCGTGLVCTGLGTWTISRACAHYQPKPILHAHSHKPPFLFNGHSDSSTTAATTATYSLSRCFKVVMRLVRLGCVFVPLLLLYPLALCTRHSLDAWWALTYFAVRQSGATVIKLAQWAATRRDLFSDDFCTRFGQLQRAARQRHFAETELILCETFGDDWRCLFRQFNASPIGAGCVAQVYKAAVNPYELIERLNLDDGGQKRDSSAKPAYIPVAIKITHDSVIDNIRTDMDILDAAARFLQYVLPAVGYLKPLSSLGDFRRIMEQQVDLRHECCALSCFRHNFRHNRYVKFPTPIFCTERVLIETFEDGLHISDFIPPAGSSSGLSAESRRVNEHLAITGVRAVCQMIFNDNFVHGDLHPGNILVQNRASTADRSIGERVQSTYRNISRSVRGWLSDDGTRQQLDRLFETDTGDDKLPSLVFLDTGITVQLTHHDLVNFRSAFTALLNMDGQEIGELLLNHAPQGQQWCSDRQAFRDDIDQLLTRVTCGKQTLMISKLDLSSVLSSLLSIVSSHRVCLVPQYACVLLAVIVLEGLGRSLHPQLDILHVSRPFVLGAIINSAAA